MVVQQHFISHVLQMGSSKKSCWLFQFFGEDLFLALFFVSFGGVEGESKDGRDRDKEHLVFL